MAELYASLVALLRERGCTFVRAGKGSHEIWFSALTQKHFSVPRSTKSRHTANEILKQAGLRKAF